MKALIRSIVHLMKHFLLVAAGDGFEIPLKRQ